MGAAVESVDERHMRQAIALALRAIATGDTPVGSLVVRDGVVVAQGIEAVRAEQDVAGHAELIAVRAACRALATFDLSACTLYTTAEPCWLCAFAIRQARVGRVVIGRPTPHIGGVTSRHPLLIEAGVPGWGEPPEVVTGLLAGECAALGTRTRRGGTDDVST